MGNLRNTKKFGSIYMCRFAWGISKNTLTTAPLSDGFQVNFVTRIFPVPLLLFQFFVCSGETFVDK